MPVKTIINDKGTINEYADVATLDIQVATNLPDKLITVTAPVSAAYTLTEPGFYYVTASVASSGSVVVVPSAADFPGGTIILADTTPGTGSGNIYVSGAAVTATRPALSLGANPFMTASAQLAGNVIKLVDGGAVTLVSTGYTWLATAVTGVLGVFR